MTRLLLSACLLTLPLALTACQAPGTKAPEGYDLSGRIGGEWDPAARLRLALVGTGFPGAPGQQANLPQNILPASDSGLDGWAWSYGVDLPNLPAAAGLYQVIAYDDRDGSGDYSLGEPLVRNRQWLIYSVAGGTVPAQTLPVQTLPVQTLPGGTALTPALQVQAGWNVYDAALSLVPGNPRPFTQLAGYDLRRE